MSHAPHGTPPYEACSTRTLHMCGNAGAQQALPCLALCTWLGLLQRLEASTFSLAVRLLCQYAACEDGASALLRTDCLLRMQRALAEASGGAKQRDEARQACLLQVGAHSRAHGKARPTGIHVTCRSPWHVSRDKPAAYSSPLVPCQ